MIHHRTGTLSTLALQIADRTATVSPFVHEHAALTPLVEFRAASERAGSQVVVKCEHQQRTGSFKLRGALAKLHSIDADLRDLGVITASTGNHGLGVAHALQALGGRGVICVPEHASPAKLAALARYDVEIRTLGQEAGETEGLARALADEQGMPYISPYNDVDVIAGQGTLGEEILQQIGDRDFDALVLSVGGGGLISGVAATVKAARPDIRIIGASPANDATMAASVRAGTIIEIPTSPTISDGTAGGIEPGAVTFPLCTELVDEWVLVSEQDIYAALRLTIESEHQLVEGAAATAIGAAVQVGRARPGRTVVAVSCGANISANTLLTALEGSQPPG